MDSENEEKSCKRRRNLLTEYSKREKDVEKDRGPGENCSPESETGSAGQIDDKAPPKQSTKIYKIASNRMEQEDKEGCPAPVSILEPHAGFDVRVRQDSKIDSQAELLSEKMIQKYKAKVAELRQETSVLRHKVQRHATKSQRLSDANSVLMDELRKLCEPHIINILEANDPNKNPQTDDTNGVIKNT